jgi:hypothetical protein
VFVPCVFALIHNSKARQEARDRKKFEQQFV